MNVIVLIVKKRKKNRVKIKNECKQKLSKGFREELKQNFFFFEEGLSYENSFIFNNSSSSHQINVEKTNFVCVIVKFFSSI